jgi:hypothetical protein
VLTHSRIAELTLQLSGRLARSGQDPRSQRTGTSVGVGACPSANRATALCSSPIRTTSPTNDPMARRRPLSTILRIPMKPATHSKRKPATDSDLKPAGVPI